MGHHINARATKMNIDERAAAGAIFKAGMSVTRKLCGPGSLESSEPGKVLRLDKRGVWLDNGEGNSPSGPFDPVTGWHPDDVFGTRQRIII